MLKQWFWRGAFSNRYSSGTTTAKMNADIEFIKAIRNKNYDDLVEYKITVNEDALINQSEFVYSVHTKIRQVVGAYTPSISIPLLYCKANQINEQLLVS